MLFSEQTHSSLGLLHDFFPCAFRPGCLMSHIWLHTPGCTVSTIAVPPESATWLGHVVGEQACVGPALGWAHSWAVTTGCRVCWCTQYGTSCPYHGTSCLATCCLSVVPLCCKLWTAALCLECFPFQLAKRSSTTLGRGRLWVHLTELRCFPQQKGKEKKSLRQ